MELKSTQLEINDQIGVIKLNRPDRMNAWTGRMHTEYRWLLSSLEANPDVRVIVVTGNGRGFCVGADNQALEGHVAKGGYDAGTASDIATPGYGVHEEFDATFAYHFGLSKPVIAAINGPAAGVGLVLACFADIRFAVPGVKFTTAHGKLNLPAEYGLSWLLPRIVGLGVANDLMFTSRVFMSDEAQQIGLVNRLVAPEDLLKETLAYAAQMVATVSPNSLRQTKRQIYLDQHRDVASAVNDSEQLLKDMMKQKDYPEAIAAYMEKRLANWSGE